jgi:hypothetical protein
MVVVGDTELDELQDFSSFSVTLEFSLQVLLQVEVFMVVKLSVLVSGL